MSTSINERKVEMFEKLSKLPKVSYAYLYGGLFQIREYLRERDAQLDTAGMGVVVGGSEGPILPKVGRFEKMLHALITIDTRGTYIDDWVTLNGHGDAIRLLRNLAHASPHRPGKAHPAAVVWAVHEVLKSVSTSAAPDNALLRNKLLGFANNALYKEAGGSNKEIPWRGLRSLLEAIARPAFRLTRDFDREVSASRQVNLDFGDSSTDDLTLPRADENPTPQDPQTTEMQLLRDVADIASYLECIQESSLCRAVKIESSALASKVCLRKLGKSLDTADIKDHYRTLTSVYADLRKGDDSLPTWRNIPEAERENISRNVAQYVYAKMSIGIYKQDVIRSFPLPRSATHTHQNWYHHSILDDVSRCLKGLLKKPTSPTPPAAPPAPPAAPSPPQRLYVGFDTTKMTPQEVEIWKKCLGIKFEILPPSMESSQFLSAFSHIRAVEAKTTLYAPANYLSPWEGV